MRLISLLAVCLALSSCMTTDKIMEEASSFDASEFGCSDFRGSVKTNPIPMVGGEATLVKKTVKPGPNGEIVSC